MNPNDEWLHKRLEKYRADRNDMYESIEEADSLEKLGQGFTSADPLKDEEKLRYNM